MSTFSLPSRDALREHKLRVIEDGYEFPLAATSIVYGQEIKIRAHRLSTTDRAAIDALPTTIQETVWAGIKKFANLVKDGGEPNSLAEAAARNDEIRKAADGFCIAAFIEPRLVATEAEVAGVPGAWCVNDIEAEDRISFLYACLDADSPQAKQLRPFRRKPSQHVSPVETEPDAAATLYALEHAQ
jgi:hypothetical protein